jgi:hypothetical protein
MPISGAKRLSYNVCVFSVATRELWRWGFYSIFVSVPLHENKQFHVPAVFLCLHKGAEIVKGVDSGDKLCNAVSCPDC